jgi:hypothetical protein
MSFSFSVAFAAVALASSRRVKTGSEVLYRVLRNDRETPLPERCDASCFIIAAESLPDKVLHDEFSPAGRGQRAQRLGGARSIIRGNA